MIALFNCSYFYKQNIFDIFRKKSILRKFNINIFHDASSYEQFCFKLLDSGNNNLPEDNFNQQTWSLIHFLSKGEHYLQIIKMPLKIVGVLVGWIVEWQKKTKENKENETGELLSRFITLCVCFTHKTYCRTLNNNMY